MVDNDFLAVLQAPKGSRVRLPAEWPPVLLVIIDTEEEFDWALPHARENTDVSAIAAQGKAQEIFSRHGIIPTYVVDYPVANSPSAVALLKAFADRGECHIGTHLHPWVNPPHQEQVTAYNSYPGNLPAGLEREKLAVLTAKITEAFGQRPVAYKAGRYGVGQATAQTLEGLGYLIDLSVVPFTDFGDDGGPDFSHAGFDPAWFGEGRRLLEIPLSVGFYGALRRFGPALFPQISGNFGMRTRLPGILARSGLLERIRLTPEGVDLAAMVRLTRSLYEQGCRVFSFTYHSPSLVPGMTPYVRSETDLVSFLGTMESFFTFFRRELGGLSSTPLELYDRLAPGLTDSGSRSELVAVRS